MSARQKEAKRRKSIAKRKAKRELYKEDAKKKKDTPLEKDSEIIVGRNSNPKQVAGAICHFIRQFGDAPVVVSVGVDANNKAVKSIIIARSYLVKEKIKVDLRLSEPILTFSEGDKTYRDKAKMDYHLELKKGSRFDPSPSDISDSAFKVSKKTNPAALSGAICMEFRKKVFDKKTVGIKAIGANCVWISVQAMAIAAKILKRDDEIETKFDIQFYDTVVKDVGKRSGIYFSCIKVENE